MGKQAKAGEPERHAGRIVICKRKGRCETWQQELTDRVGKTDEDRQTDKQTDRHIDKQTGRQADRQTERSRLRQTGRYTDREQRSRQTDR